MGNYKVCKDKAYNYINALIDVVPEVTSPCWEAVLRWAVFSTLECFPLFSPHPPRKRWHLLMNNEHFSRSPTALLCDFRVVSALLFVSVEGSAISFCVSYSWLAITGFHSGPERWRLCLGADSVNDRYDHGSKVVWSRHATAAGYLIIIL